MSIRVVRVKQSLSPASRAPRFLLVVLCCSCPLAHGAAAAPTDVADTVADAASARTEAVWLEHDLKFWYRGRNTFYSCDALAQRVGYLLHAVGVRPDAKVSIYCLNSTMGPGQMPSIRIKAALPAEATPEVLAQASEQAPKRALIRRVQGKKEPLVQEDTAPFPAAWRTVVIDTREDKILEGGDCELVEQFVKQIIRPLGVRVEPSSTLRCMPHAPLTGWVTLTLQTLQPYTPPVPINALQTPIGPH
jgi:hypothetical protein